MLGIMAIALVLLSSIRKSGDESISTAGSVLSNAVSVVFGLFGILIALIGIGFWFPALKPSIENDETEKLK